MKTGYTPVEHGGPALFHIGSFEVTSVMTTSAAITIFLLTLAFFSTRRLDERPGRVQNLAEKLVEMLEDFLAGMIGPHLARTYLPYLGTLFIFILVSNYSGLLPLAGTLPGLAAPTSSLSVTASLALCTFLAVQYVGLRQQGLRGYAASFLRPAAFMLPLLLLEQCIRPVSLSLRLYGNIYGEEAVAHELFRLAPLLAPLIPQVLSLLLGFVQAMVFTMLSCIYIQEASGEEE